MSLKPPVILKNKLVCLRLNTLSQLFSTIKISTQSTTSKNTSINWLILSCLKSTTSPQHLHTQCIYIHVCLSIYEHAWWHRRKVYIIFSLCPGSKQTFLILNLVLFYVTIKQIWKTIQAGIVFAFHGNYACCPFSFSLRHSSP